MMVQEKNFPVMHVSVKMISVKYFFLESIFTKSLQGQFARSGIKHPHDPPTQFSVGETVKVVQAMRLVKVY